MSVSLAAFLMASSGTEMLPRSVAAPHAARAGASVPLLGFGHLLAQGVVKAVDEIGLPGVFTGGIGAAAGGITASLVFALLAALVGKSKDQN